MSPLKAVHGVAQEQRIVNRNGLLMLWDYNTYANHLVFDAAARLTDADLARVASPSHGSAHDLLFHILESDAFFVALCQGHPLDDFPAILTCAEMRQRSETLSREARAYIGVLTETDLAREVSTTIKGHPIRLTVAQALTQALVHSIHHRGELSIVLSELGQPLPTLDILLQFIKESGQTLPV